MRHPIWITTPSGRLPWPRNKGEKDEAAADEEAAPAAGQEDLRASLLRAPDGDMSPLRPHLDPETNGLRAPLREVPLPVLGPAEITRSRLFATQLHRNLERDPTGTMARRRVILRPALTGPGISGSVLTREASVR